MAGKRDKKPAKKPRKKKPEDPSGKKKKPEDPSGKLKVIIDIPLAKALSHKYRSHILATLGDRIASPKEMADELGVESWCLGYHIKELVDHELIRLVSIEKRRGFYEHFYTLCSRILYLDDSEWRRMPEPIRCSLSASLLQIVFNEAVEALRVGTFNARESHQSRTAMVLDELGCREVTELLNETLEGVLKIRKTCSRRLEKEPGEGIPIEVFMIGFETAAGADRDRDSGTTGSA